MLILLISQPIRSIHKEVIELKPIWLQRANDRGYTIMLLTIGSLPKETAFFSWGLVINGKSHELYFVHFTVYLGPGVLSYRLRYVYLYPGVDKFLGKESVVFKVHCVSVYSTLL